MRGHSQRARSNSGALASKRARLVTILILLFPVVVRSLIGTTALPKSRTPPQLQEFQEDDPGLGDHGAEITFGPYDPNEGEREKTRRMIVCIALAAILLQLPVAAVAVSAGADWSTVKQALARYAAASSR